MEHAAEAFHCVIQGDVVEFLFDDFQDALDAFPRSEAFQGGCGDFSDEVFAVQRAGPYRTSRL